MSAQINDGGPAFPVPSVAWKEKGEDRVAIGTRGMTLRDYFAGQTLTGLLLCPGQVGEAAQGDPANAAEWAYQQADAMLAAREAKP